MQLKAREALNKWKKIEQIFLTEERQKENYILNNEYEKEDYYKNNNKNIEENEIKPIILKKNNINNNKNNYNKISNIKTLKINEIKSAEKEDINSLKINKNNFILDKYNNYKNYKNQKQKESVTLGLNSNNDNIYNNIKEKNNLILLLKSSLSKIINDSINNNQNYFNNINYKLNTMNERINDLEKKISKINKQNNSNKYKYNNIIQKENQLNLFMLPKVNTINNDLKSSQQIESQINEKWKETLKLLSKNKISEAYKLILSSGDDIYLLRLVCITGPVLYLLEEELAKNVLIRINKINRGKQIQDVLVKLVEESIKYKRNNNSIFFNLNYKEQNDILDSLFVIFKNKKNNSLTIKAQELYTKIIEQSKNNQNN